MAEVIWTEPALSDLDTIADYIALDNPTAARELVQRVLDHVAQLQDHPESGTRPPELKRSRYRQLIEPPCRILYRYDKQHVYVLFVMRTERLLGSKQLPPRNNED